MDAIQPILIPARPRGVLPLSHLALLSVLSLAAVAWGGLLIIGREGHELDGFIILAGLYAIGSAAFIGSRLRFGSFRLFDIPSLVTAIAFVEFGLAPLACLLFGVRLDSPVDGDYALFERALVYMLLGMGAFWLGCLLLSRMSPPKAIVPPEVSIASTASPPIGRAVICALVLYSAAFLVKTYLLENFGFGYGASEDAYFQNLAAMQVATVVFQVGTYALVILAVERSFHPLSLERKVLFWLVFVPECVWGLLSGMKGELLQNFLLVGVVVSMAARKVSKGWIAAAFLGLAIVYPFSNRYRDLVRSRPLQAMDLSSAGQISAQALAQAGDGSGVQGWLAEGAGLAIARLNLLQSVAELMNLGSRAKLLQGEERWWMLPFYPFIPRFIWQSKPILDKGRRFSIALGLGDQTSTALTYPGDLVSEFGVAGLLCGMFLFGIAAQHLTDRFAGILDKRRIFIYTGLVVTVLNILELDAFDFWSTLIRNLVILSVVAWFAYRAPQSRGSVPCRAPACESRAVLA
jgi:hypothetical protein